MTTQIDAPNELDAVEVTAKLKEFASLGDPAALLMTLVEHTGNMDYLDEFGAELTHPPKQKVRGLIPRALVSDATFAKLVDTLALAIQQPATDERPSHDDAKMQRMLNVLTGYDVPLSYAPMIAEESALRAPQPVIPRTKSAPTGFKVAILGSGMTGLSAAIRLQEQGVEFDIFERLHEVGGTWNVHRYPGVAVDTPSLYYSLPNMLRDWSRFYPLGDEYQQYLVDLANHFGIRDRVTFGAEVTKLRWHEDRQEWEISLTIEGEERTHFANAVVSAFGYLNDPKSPNIPGQETFKGRIVHTGQWPEDLDLTGLRVGQIGSGATGVQIAEAMQHVASSFTIFQRQAHWILPDLIGDPNVSEGERWLVANVPTYNEWIRAKTFWLSADVINYPRVRVDHEWMAEHPESISESNHATYELCVEYIQKHFGHDPELMKKMTPDFPANGKRNVRDPGTYYAGIAAGTIKVEDTGIQEFVPEGIKLTDGRVIELDVLLFATGFNLRFTTDIETIGRDGRVLAQEWEEDGPRAYVGGVVNGFPNLFLTSSPNGAVGHGGGHNFQVDNVVQWMSESLQMLFENDAQSFDVNKDVQDAYGKEVDECMAGSIWGLDLSAHTYYKNQSGRTILPSPFTLMKDWELHRSPRQSDFLLS